MFRIENYITGIIISYIDRYISNFKRQDAQVSLWEGDAVLHNLDLDLEVLDQELNLPFSLVSGHIHELHIHVPWTRIASEPVVITINTIECVMKLKPPGQEQVPKKKKKKKATNNAEEAPPTYTAALANKVVYNLNITCNNLILKYVEEDIVLSMNIKTLSAVSVNKKWTPMYCALTPENLILRKLITLTDITICLDKRNASGRIESYLEPILYKCSLKIRISRTFSSATNLNAIKSRIAIHTDDVTLSISEPQVPMLLRLIMLAKATFNSPKNGSIPSLQIVEGSSENNGEDGEEGQSWGSWVWSMVPSLFTYTYGESEFSSIPQTLDIAAYIDKFNLDLKLVEEGKTWLSFMKATLEGCFVEMTTNTNDWTNLLFGVSYITVCPLPQTSNDIYLKCGRPMPAYKKNSLYENPDVNLVQRTWDLHLSAITEKVLVDRAPALSVDFISSTEIQAENWIENYPSEPLEKTLMRFIVGTLDINATPGLMERIKTIKQSLENYDYPAYSLPTSISGEDMSLHLKESNSRVLEGLVPLSLYQFTLVEANVKVFASLTHMSASKQRLFNDISRTHLGKKQPYLYFKIKSLDGSITKPMYPEVLMLLKQHISPSRELISASMTTVAVTGLTINLGVKIDGVEIPDMIEFSKMTSSAVFNSIFQSGPEVICLHCSLQLERSTLTSTKPMLILGWSLLETYLSANNSSFLFNSSLLQDVVNSSYFPFLQMSIYKFQGRFAQSRVSESVKLKIGTAEAKSYYINNPGQDHFSVLSAKTLTENSVFEGIAQRPLNESMSVPLLLYFKSRQLHVNLDPSVFKWVTYMPQVQPSGNIHSWTSMGSGGLSRKISASSVSSLSKKLPEISETPKGRVEQTPPPVATTSTNLADDFMWLMKWLSFAVNGEMSDFKFLYKGLSGENSCTLTTYIPSVHLTSAQGKFTIESDSLPIPYGVLRKNSVSFPLRLEINGISGWSFCGGQRENFFDEFNTTCTAALTSTVVPTPLLSFSLHVDTSHISLSLARHQMACLTEFCTSIMKIMNISPMADRKTDELQVIRERRASGSEDSTSNSQTVTTSLNQNAFTDRFGFKLSWWLQWTLTKLSISLFTTPMKSSPDLLKLTLEFEDIISSVEVDPVYQKLKMKVGSSTIKHFSRDSLNGKWQVGCFGGYMMCAREPLGQHREFLSLTVTRASAVNLHSKLASLLKISYKDLTAGQRPEDRYVVEVVIYLEPIDFIIAPYVLMRFVSIIEPLLNQSGAQPGSPPGPPLTHLTTADLPLVYFDLHQLRIFLCSSKPPSSKPDTFVIQVDDIVLRSEAVNPVSRKMLRCDLSRVTSVPGSRLEDRQYQLDLLLEVTTGRWEELEVHICGNSEAEENPAVAWNTVGAPQAGRSAALSTVLAKLKTSFIFAPPILSSGVLVSGLYFESNMESEADIKLSTDQFKLWLNLLSELNSVLPEPSDTSLDLDSGIESIEGSLNLSFSKDAFEVRKSSRVLNSQISVATSTSINTRGIRQRTQVVPSDILLTAKGISFKLFSKEESTSKLQPLLYISITQPYVSYEKQGDTTVYKASVFDLNIRHGEDGYKVDGNIKRDDFVFTVLETRDGDPDPYKGIPPALANFKSTAFGMKLPMIDFEMGRPLKVIVNIRSICFLNSLQELLFSSNISSIYSLGETQQHKSSLSVLSYDKKAFFNSFSGFNISTKQLAVEYLPENSCNTLSMSAIASLGELGGTITFPGQQTSLSLSVKGVALSVGGHLLLTPWSFGCNASLINESWTPNYIYRISVNSDVMAMELYHPQISAFKTIIEELQTIFTKKNTRGKDSSAENIAKKVDDDDESYRDDLQTGAFQFSNGNDMPLPYQVTFPSPAVMAWAYPYPRTITSLTILPVPFTKPCPAGLELNLEYLDPLQGWCLRAKGLLTESQVTKMELPLRNCTASVWRVVLDAEDLPIQSKILGGCLRVDSLFARRLIPTLQASVAIDCFSVCLWVKPKECQPLKRYTPVSSLSRYPFSTISIQSVRIGLYSWLSGEGEIGIEGRPKVEILNARTLKDVTVVPAFPFKGSCYLKEQFVKFKIEGEVLTAFVAPSVTHTLHAAITGSFVQPYIVCNDTSYILSFGQADTEEDIPLYCLQSYFYAWKNSLQKMNLRFSISTTEHKFWSVGVPLCREGITPIEVMDDGGRTMCALILIKKLSSVVYQVTFSGELMIKNRLDKGVDIRIVASSIAERQRILRLQGEERCPAVLLTRESSYSIRIAMHSGWSGLIPLNESTSWLVKVPQRENGNYISVWCQVLREDNKGFKRLLVILSPMYMIKSLLPGDTNLLIQTEELHSQLNLKIPGRGNLTNLYTPGTTEHRHALTFHIVGNVPSSVPHVNLSYTDVIQSSAPSTPSLQGALSEEEQHMSKDNWPLLGPPWDRAVWGHAPQPPTVTRVKVRFCGEKLRVPHCILIELEPWCLVVNTLGHTISILSGEEVLCSVPHLSIVAPPYLENTFNLLVNFGDGVYRSSGFQLSDNQSFYKPHIPGLIPQVATVHIKVYSPNSVVFGVLHSKMVQNTRSLHFTSAYVISNLSSHDLNVTGYSVKLSNRKITLPSELSPCFTFLPKKSSIDLTVPLPEWLDRGDGSENRLYLIFTGSAGHSGNPIPVPVISDARERETLLLPTGDDEGWYNVPLSVIFQEKEGVTYITVDDDSSPQVVIHNHTGHNLLMGTSTSAQGGSATEESEDWDWRLTFPKGRCGYYRIHGAPGQPLPPVVVAKSGKNVEWSGAIYLTPGSGARLVGLPGAHDLVVTVSKVAFTTHLTLTPAHQSLISAADVRSRLTLHAQGGNQMVAEEESKPLISIQEQTVQEVVTCRMGCYKKSSGFHYIEGTVALKGLHFTLCSDSNDSPDWNEIAALSLENITANLKPEKNYVGKSSLQVSIWDVQLDNQKYSQGGYDFCVVTVGRGSSQTPDVPETNTNTLSMISSTKEGCPAINITFGLDVTHSVVLEHISAALMPFELFLEDTYLTELKGHVKDLSSGILLKPVLKPSIEEEPEENKVNNESSKESLSVEYPISPDPPLAFSHSAGDSIESDDDDEWEKETPKFKSIPLPSELVSSSYELSRPLKLTKLYISPLSLRVSLHTSTKFYIALDQSPLSFAEFKRTDVVTSPYRLGHALTLHYFLGAIYGTGWALGSLQLLGAPAGLARSLGAGLSSLVSLPYEGLAHGPAGFLFGVFHGSASLMRHVTAGTLSCVTKLAGSWSRTLDRLTLDSEDLRYAEEMRRLRPHGLTEGIKQGLTEFGVSLLGGVGGLAQRPLEYALGTGGSLVGSVSRGLVGAMARPLSGAAGLVAVTTQGILAGAGWAQILKPKHTTGCISIGRASRLVHGEGALLVIEATSGDLQPCDLVLNLSSLRVISLTGRQDILPLSDIIAVADGADPTLVFIYQQSNSDMAEKLSQKRITEFVRESQRALGSPLPPTPPSLDPEPLLFYINPEGRDYFVSYVQIMARHASNKGFSLINTNVLFS